MWTRGEAFKVLDSSIRWAVESFEYQLTVELSEVAEEANSRRVACDVRGRWPSTKFCL